MTVGLLGGLTWLWSVAPRRGFRRAHVIQWLWVVSFVTLAFGRLGYVAANWDYFSAHKAMIIRPDQVGGLYGGCAWLGGLIVTWVWAKITGRHLYSIIGLLAPATLFFTAMAWYGSQNVGNVWAKPAWTAPSWARWLIVESPDLYHTMLPRYAIHRLAAGWALAMTVLAVVFSRSSGIATALYHAGAAGLTWLRDDPVAVLYTYRSDFLLDITLALLFLLLSVRSRSRHRNNER